MALLLLQLIELDIFLSLILSKLTQRVKFSKFINYLSDLRKARLLMKALREQVTDNTHGWLGGARVEELDGKIGAAR